MPLCSALWTNAGIFRDLLIVIAVIFGVIELIRCSSACA